MEAARSSFQLIPQMRPSHDAETRELRVLMETDLGAQAAPKSHRRDFNQRRRRIRVRIKRITQSRSA